MNIFFGTWILVLTLAAFYIMWDAIQRRRTIYLFLMFVNVAVLYLMLQMTVERVMESEMPLSGAWIFLFVTLTVIETGLIVYLHLWRQRHISLASIKDGLDGLTDGLCYYYEDGRLVFVNPAMNDIAREVTGRFATDGRLLWDCLANSRAFGSARYYDSGSGQVLGMPGGNIYRIVRNRCSFLKSPAYEIIAYDITEEYNLGLKLRERNERLAGQKKRLLEINDTISDLTIEKEILQTKVNIHDDLGKALVGVRSYMSDNIGKKELLGLMNTAISMIDAQKISDRPDDYATVLKAASDIGVNVEITGDLPEDDDDKQLIAAAMRECITNTFRHAKGDTLYIRSYVNDNSEKAVQFTNNGEAPHCTITETGGLSYLRHLAERRGAGMHITSSPQFVLLLTLPDVKRNEYENI